MNAESKLFLDTDESGERHLRIDYLRGIGRAGLTYRPEFASGLNPADWAPATGEVEVTPVGFLGVGTLRER